MDRKRAASPASAEAPWVIAGPPGAAALLSSVCASPLALWRQRDWLRLAIARALRAELQGTVLGWLWPLARPALLFVVYGFFFHELVGWRLAGLPDERRFALGVWMFTGAVVWSGLADALGRATTAFVDAGRWLRRASFPTELLPLVATATPLVWMCAALLAFVLTSALTPLWPAPPVASLVLLPLLVALQALLVWGAGLVASTLHVHLRDTHHAIGLALAVLVFATPVFWVPSPTVVPGLERWLDVVTLNPLHHVLQCWRFVLLGPEPRTAYTTTFAHSLAVFAATAVTLWVVGLVVFKSARRTLFDEV